MVKKIIICSSNTVSWMVHGTNIEYRLMKLQCILDETVTKSQSVPSLFTALLYINRAQCAFPV